MYRLPHLLRYLQNVWTSRDGVEYAWFNNVETKPGIGFPKNWEDQEKWNGGWVRKSDGKLVPKQGGKLKILSNIFANPNMPKIDDYYEPFTYDYEHLQNAPKNENATHRASHFRDYRQKNGQSGMGSELGRRLGRRI